MGERVCLRCDWTGATDGAACPRCGASLYRVQEPTTPRGVIPASRPQRHPAGEPMPGSPIKAAQDDESVPPTEPVAAASSRRAVIAGALTVAAILIVATVWFDRAQTPAVPGAVETGPAVTFPTETGPAESGPPTAAASAAPDVVRQRTCSDGARPRLELTDLGDRIQVRFEVHRSPVGHEWRIRFRYVKERNLVPVHGHVFFRGTRVAWGSGVFVVHLRVPGWRQVAGVVGKAVDRQTGQVCKASSLR